MGNRVEKAVELFKSGYNCAQSVFTAYADFYGIDKDLALNPNFSILYVIDISYIIDY